MDSLSIPLWSDFISVGLREGLPHWRPFQSHYGLILSPVPARCSRKVKEAFNPTMVWFYLLWNLWVSVPRPQLSIPLWSDFIQAYRIDTRAGYTCFQSHYGLILSGDGTGVKRERDNLSIPLWSDFILNQRQFPFMFQNTLSIPLWSDFINR